MSYGVIAFLALLAVALIADVWMSCRKWRPTQKPQRRATDKIERVNQLLASAAHHREMIEAIAEEFVSLHGYEPSTNEADDLEHVIFDGGDYAETMHRIMRMKRSAK